MEIISFENDHLKHPILRLYVTRLSRYISNNSEKSEDFKKIEIDRAKI